MSSNQSANEKAWQDVIAEAQQGDKSARDSIVQENMGLVYMVAKRFADRGTDREELVQLGAIGLIKAVDKFDPAMGFSFSTYAVPMIMGEIRRFLRDDNMIHVSRRLKENARKIAIVRENIKKTKYREPTMAELEAQTGLSREELVAAMESAYTVESISQPVHGAKEDAHTLTIEDQLEDKESFESPVLNRIALTQAMDELEEWEAQLIRMRYTRDRIRRYRGFVFSRVGNYFHQFYSDYLPFALTNAQKRVIKEIRTDMGSGRQMNRLLQGDVGSGKTLVALMCMLIALDNGFQACIMAPTEILAEQHLETFRKFLGDMPVTVELLKGSVKGKRRQAVLDGVRDGSVQILVGTHAVLEDPVVFQNLGMVVIDEQHRFGVAQRARLWGKNTWPPHVLVMTATPIPRTLAMTLYGDLEVSVIDELPPGRKPIQTTHRFENQRESLYQGVRREIQRGRQVYVVYPLIQESEKLDIKNLEEGYEHLRQVFPEYRISKVHGKMKAQEKDEEMQRFISGETQILVATTVIEVGVNVPNASVMIIENAERFGLAQLHQLRGRVGRGAEQSYCILVTKYELSKDTRRRMQIMTETNDGFEIAEEDLKLRGPGDLEGTQQSGIAFDLKLANLARDGQILELARQKAQGLLDNDPDENRPENRMVWARLEHLRKNQVNWSAIS